MALLRRSCGLWLKLIGKGEHCLAFLRGMGVPSLGSALSVTLLCHDFGSRKLVGKGVARMAFLRRINDPPLGSDLRMASLR